MPISRPFSQKKMYLLILLCLANSAILGCIVIQAELIIGKRTSLDAAFWTMLITAVMFYLAMIAIAKRQEKRCQIIILGCFLSLYLGELFLFRYSGEILLLWTIVLLTYYLFWDTRKLYYFFIITGVTYLVIPQIAIKVLNLPKSALYSYSNPKPTMYATISVIIVLIIIACNKKNEDSIKKREEQILTEYNQKISDYINKDIEYSSTARFHDIKNLITVQNLNIETICRLIKNENRFADSKYIKLINATLIANDRLTLLVDVNRSSISEKTGLNFFSPGEELEVIILSHKELLHAQNIHILKDIDKQILIKNTQIYFYKIFQNIIENAIDSFSGVGGRCNKEIHVRLRAKDNNLIISISDNGKGIAEEHLRKIYDPLFSTKGPNKGTGIGLTIVKHYIQTVFKGQIEVTSTLNKGTTFTVKLPLNQK